MNSKLSNKPSKKDRPRSTDKITKAKRRGDQTPEKSVTPEPSVQGVCDEGNQVPGGVLSREDIESLAVNLDELQKQRPPKRPTVESTSKQVTVRKAVKLKEVTEPKNGKTITVARAVVPDSDFNTYRKIGNNDPSVDDTTAFFEHHILGTLKEFNEQNEQKQQAKKIPASHTEKTHSSSPKSPTKVIKGRTFPACIYQSGMDQSNALSNWEQQMIQRKKQQGHLARLLNTSTDMLGMNQNEEYRTMQEERHLIDRSIHSKDYGKGYRVGSEFWKQAELIGDEDSGIHMTLTQTERGYPPVIEHVGKPDTVKKETGLDWADPSKSYRSMVIHRPWKKSTYLQTRKEDLREAINELCPHKPYLQDLEVVGERLTKEVISSSFEEIEQEKDNMEYHTSLTEDMSQEYIDPLSSHQDVLPAPIFGPSLTIAGRSASWNGSTHNRLGEVGLSCRVLLEANVNERTVSTLDIYNDGTAAIYYSWKSVTKENKLGTTSTVGKQRFYFDKNSGVILPGDTLKFPFTFKSPNPGMFSEEWQLDTQPVLNGAAAIRVLLRGLALQDDLTVDKRNLLERELGDRQARQIVESIVREILDGIRSPERPVSPVDAYLTDEESFVRNNPELAYNEEVIQELKQLYHDIKPDGEWDLRLSSLRELIMLTEYEEEDQLDGYLSRLNHHVKNLAFPPRQPFKQEMYSTCYIMLCEMVDDLVTHSDMIRNTMGLPLKEMIEGNSDDGQDKKTKKTPDAARLNADKKDSKKDKKSGDRPISSQRTKTPMDKKLSRGNSQNQSRSSTTDNLDDVAATPDDDSLEQITLITEEQYREKLYFKAYSLVSETVERIAGMLEDIGN